MRACNERGILIDLSHLNRRGFLDVARLSDAPLVATHSNAWALCRGDAEPRRRAAGRDPRPGGVVGVNFAVDVPARRRAQRPGHALEEVCRHVDYLAERMGVDHVAFGSDYEGAEVPAALADAASGLPLLVEALRGRGHDVAKLTHGNWLRVLRETWG